VSPTFRRKCKNKSVIRCKTKVIAGLWWLTPVILATQEGEIRRITVQSQPRQIVCETLSRKHPSQKGLAECLKVKALSSSPSTVKKKKSHSLGNEEEASCGALCLEQKLLKSFMDQGRERSQNIIIFIIYFLFIIIIGARNSEPC
jgi:hypothetical protein